MAGHLALGYPFRVRVTASQMSKALAMLTFHWGLTLTSRGHEVDISWGGSRQPLFSEKCA